MYYESKISHIKVNDNGKLKRVSFVSLTDCDLHGEAEASSYRQYEGLTDIDVVSVKRSRIIEIINEKGEHSQSFLLTLCSKFVDDDGTEKRTRYVTLIWADTMKYAESIAHEYVKQGLGDLEIIKIEKSKITDIIP